MASARHLPDTCDNIFQVQNLSDKKEAVSEGTIEVTETGLIYTDSETHHKRLWPLKYIRRYGCHDDVFSFEAGRQCAGGQGLYAFKTDRASSLRALVAANTLKEARYQTPRVKTSLASAKTNLTSFPQRLAVSMPQLNEPGAGSPSHTAKPRVSSGLIVPGSMSIQHLPSAVFEAKNMGENLSASQQGFLEVTITDLFYTDSVTQKRHVWPLRFLRKFGHDGDLFTFEAGRRCPEGEGIYRFFTVHATEICDLIKKNTKMGRSFQPSRSTPSTPISPSPLQTQAIYQNTPGHNGEVQHRDDTGRSMSPQRCVFEVRNISDKKEAIHEGMLEVTLTDIIYTDGETKEKWSWPMKYLKKYGCEGDVFSLEAGRKCPRGEGCFAFSTPQALEIRDAVNRNVTSRNRSQPSLSSSLPSRSSPAMSPTHVKPPVPRPRRSTTSPISTRARQPTPEHEIDQSPPVDDSDYVDVTGPDSTSQGEPSSVASPKHQPLRRKYSQIVFRSASGERHEASRKKSLPSTAYSRIRFEQENGHEDGKPEPVARYRNIPSRRDREDSMYATPRPVGGSYLDHNRISPPEKPLCSTLRNGSSMPCTPTHGSIYQNIDGVRASEPNGPPATLSSSLPTQSFLPIPHGSSYQNLTCSLSDDPILVDSSGANYENIHIREMSAPTSYTLVEFPENGPSMADLDADDVPDSGTVGSDAQDPSARERSSVHDHSRVIYGELDFKVMEAVSQLQQQREMENVQKQQKQDQREKEKEKSATGKRSKKDQRS